MKLSELINQLTKIYESHGDLPMARLVDQDYEDQEQGYGEYYTYSFSSPVIMPMVEQEYSGYTELIDVTGEESSHDSKNVVTLGQERV